MACVYTYKGKEYSEREFKKLLSSGELRTLAEQEAVSLNSKFYQQEKSQKDIVKSILDMGDGLVKIKDEKDANNGNYIDSNQNIFTSVTNRIKKAIGIKFNQNVSKEQKDAWESFAAYGTKLHSFAEDIMNRMQGKSGVVNTNTLNSEDAKAYNKLHQALKVRFFDSIQTGSVFISEVVVKDPKRKLAGTIDLIEITPDGKLNLYDFKSRNKNELSRFKVAEYNEQVLEYTKILESMLGLEVSKRRIIPIKVSYKKSEGIVVEEDVAVALERTGVKELDIFLDKLSTQLSALEEKIKGKKGAEREKIQDQIEKKAAAIQQIQIKKSIDLALETAIEDIGHIRAEIHSGNKFLNSNEYESAKNTLDFYSNILKYSPEGYLTPSELRDIDSIVLLSQKALNELRKTTEQVLTDTAQMQQVQGDVLEAQKPIGFWSRYILGASYSENPLIQTVRVLVEKALFKTRQSVSTFNEKLKTVTDEYLSYVGERNFDLLLQVNEKGEKTGNIIDRIRPEYYRLAKQALSTSNFQWFVENSVFDEEKYAADYKQYSKYLSEFKFTGKDGSLYNLSDTKVQERLAKWVKNNKENWSKYHKAKDTWIDSKWKDIKQGKYKNTAVERFYDFYTSSMKELLEGLPVENVYSNFIPNIKSGLLDSIAESGLTGVAKKTLDFSFLETLEDDPKFGKFDANNNPINNIPILFTNKLTPTEKSYDLAKLLSLFASTSYNYKNMVEIEGVKSMALSYLGDPVTAEEIVMTKTGKEKKTAFGLTRIKDKISNIENGNYGLLKDYTDAVFYGRKNNLGLGGFKSKTLDKITSWAKGEDFTKERYYSFDSMFNGALRFTAAKGLGLNMFAPVVNLLAGKSNAYFEGIKGRFYDTGDLTKAYYLLTRNDEKARLLIDYFKIQMGERLGTDASKLTTKITDKSFEDIAFLGFHIGDYVVQNATLIASLLSGKNQIKWEDFQVKDGKLEQVNKLDELTVVKFRNRVNKLNKNIMGNMDTYDQAALKKYALGRAVLQFRSWLPSMYEERWGSEKYDHDLDITVKGRYLTMIDIVKKLYNTEAKKLLSWKELSDQEKAAVKANLLEISVVAVAMLLHGALKGDDDDKEQYSPLERYTIRVIDRYIAELVFFSLAPNTMDEKFQILISPAAAVSTIEDLGKLFEHAGKAMAGDEDSKFGRKISNFLPYYNQLQRFYRRINGDE
jgi:hypothetical protein